MGLSFKLKKSVEGSVALKKGRRKRRRRKRRRKGGRGQGGRSLIRSISGRIDKLHNDVNFLILVWRSDFREFGVDSISIRTKLSSQEGDGRDAFNSQKAYACTVDARIFKEANQGEQPKGMKISKILIVVTQILNSVLVELMATTQSFQGTFFHPIKYRTF